MKNLLLVLAGVALSGAAQAADPVEWKHSGEIRVRHTNTTNETAIEKDAKVANNSNVWEQRTKLGLTAMKGSDLTGHIGLLNAQNWGRDYSALSGSGEPTDGTNINQNNGKNLVMIAESYFWWKSSDMMSWKVGRGGMTLADGSVVSVNDYEQVPRVFDGVLGAFDFSFLNLNIFGVKSAEFGKGEGTVYQSAYDREATFYGFSADFKNLPDVLKMANVHLIKEHKDKINESTANSAVGAASNALYRGKDYMRYGATVGGDYMGFDYKLTYAGLTGKDRWFRNEGTVEAKELDFTVEANMIDFAAGYSMPDMMGFRFGVTYHQDSGDKDGAKQVANATPANAANGDKKNGRYDSFHYDQKKYAAETGLIGWGNLTAIGLDAAIAPIEDTTVGLKYVMFSRTSDKDTPNSTISHTPYTGTAELGTGTNTEKALGTELSLTADHKYSDGFNIGFRYSMFDPGAYFKKSKSDTADTEVKRDSVSQWSLQARYQF